MEKEKFKKITKNVIDKLEGGYYNPLWHNTGDKRYSNSGETMFGIDRLAGGSINDTPAGKKFWNIIDQNKTTKVWKWNYKGGALSEKLKDLAVEIMFPLYENYSKQYFTPKAKLIVDNNDKLLFNFSYALWNGAGWFKKFASDINKAVEKGVTKPEELITVAINSRTKEGLKKGSPPNSLIKQGGEKIATFIQGINFAQITELAKKNSPLLILIVFIGIIILIKQK